MFLADTGQRRLALSFLVLFAYLKLYENKIKWVT